MRLLFARRWKVGDAIGNVANHLSRGCAIEARLVDVLLQIPVKRGADKKIEISDGCESLERDRRGEGGLAQDRAQTCVSLFAPLVRRRMPAHHIVERIWLRQARGVGVELGGEPVLEQARARIGIDFRKLRADDRDVALHFDEVEPIITRVFA